MHAALSPLASVVPSLYPALSFPARRLSVRPHAVDRMRQRHRPVRTWSDAEVRCRVLWMVRRGRNLGGGRRGGRRFVAYKGLVFVIRQRTVRTVVTARVLDLRAGAVRTAPAFDLEQY